jgi:hypothetical protein
VVHGGVVHLGLGDEEGFGVNEFAHIRFPLQVWSANRLRAA